MDVIPPVIVTDNNSVPQKVMIPVIKSGIGLIPLVTNKGPHFPVTFVIARESRDSPYQYADPALKQPLAIRKEHITVSEVSIE